MGFAPAGIPTVAVGAAPAGYVWVCVALAERAVVDMGLAVGYNAI